MNKRNRLLNIFVLAMAVGPRMTLAAGWAAIPIRAQDGDGHDSQTREGLVRRVMGATWYRCRDCVFGLLNATLQAFLSRDTPVKP
jgi:hypothetical protein